MDDLISRQAAIDALTEYFDRIGKLKRRGLNQGEKAICLDVIGAVKTLPSAQPEIIRCKDCMKYDSHGHRCKHWNHGVVVMDFCSRAERRTDERLNQQAGGD